MKMHNFLKHNQKYLQDLDFIKKYDLQQYITPQYTLHLKK